LTSFRGRAKIQNEFRRTTAPPQPGLGEKQSKILPCITRIELLLLLLLLLLLMMMMMMMMMMAREEFTLCIVLYLDNVFLIDEE
jgi:hypothetical protein